MSAGEREGAGLYKAHMQLDWGHPPPPNFQSNQEAEWWSVTRWT
jgi:hypothetical protein